jgi:hypothetical protein
MMRLRMSRPLLSAPEREPGARRLQRVRTETRFGSLGASSGAKTPVTTKAMHDQAAERRQLVVAAEVADGAQEASLIGSGPSPVADPRVEERVQDVDEQVDEHERGREHQQQALHERDVALARRLRMSSRPCPGQANTSSVMTAPPTM